VELTSPILYAKLTGDYNIAELPRLMMNYVNDYFPLEMAIDPTDMPPSLAIEPGAGRVVADQKFELLVTISKPLKVLSMFIPQLTQLDTASIKATFASRDKSLDMTAIIPEIKYSNIQADSIRLVAAGDKNDLTVSLLTYSLNYSDKMKIPLAFNATMRDDEMEVGRRQPGARRQCTSRHTGL
jgi:hypothetical protein